MIKRYLSFFICALLLASCAMVDHKKAPARLTASDFKNLNGWEGGDHTGALEAFKRSCEKDLLKKEGDDPVGPLAEDGWPVGGTASHWREPCQSAVILVQAPNELSREQAKSFFEKWFRPWQVSAGSRETGLFTGYYEPQLMGSRYKQRAYQTPLLARPEDLVMVNLGIFRDDLAGRRIAGRVEDSYLKPYETRAEIDKGMLAPHAFNPIVWVDDPVSAFFLHIQGSGQVVLEDGTITRVGYDGHNGHPYYAIGRELVKRGVLEPKEVSMQAIEHYLKTNPDQMSDILHKNKSYIFFRELDKGPIGAEGVILTAERSLAVDYTKLPYGAPIWVDIEPPLKDMVQIRRLMVSQDTGGAINGAVRGDVFWGAGARAEEIAGHMKSEGKKWILLPQSLK